VGGDAQIGDIDAPIIPEIPLIIAAAAALPGLMGRSARSAAALNGLLAAGEGDSPDGGGSSSSTDGIVRAIAIAFLQSWSCLWQRFPFRTYSTAVDGGYQNHQKMMI